MIKFVVILFIFIVIFYMWHYKVRFDFRSLFRRGKHVSRGPYGCYVFDGCQGSGKTTSISEYLLYHSKSKKIIFSNIQSYHNDSCEVIHFVGFDGLQLILDAIDAGIYRDKGQIYIIYDELLTLVNRSIKMGLDLAEFMAQLRKRQIILLGTTQYWSSINVDFRRLCRYRIVTSIWFGRFIINRYEDAERIKYNSITQEYDAPYVKTFIYKLSLKGLQSFDTRERIRKS